MKNNSICSFQCYEDCQHCGNDWFCVTMDLQLTCSVLVFLSALCTTNTDYDNTVFVYTTSSKMSRTCAYVRNTMQPEGPMKY